MKHTEFIEGRANSYIALVQRLKEGQLDSEEVAAVVEQCGKDWRSMQMAHVRVNGNGSSGDRAATPSQLNLLRKLDVKIPTDCTVKQASALIDQARGNGQ